MINREIKSLSYTTTANDPTIFSGRVHISSSKTQIKQQRAFNASLHLSSRVDAAVDPSGELRPEITWVEERHMASALITITFS